MNVLSIIQSLREAREKGRDHRHAHDNRAKGTTAIEMIKKEVQQKDADAEMIDRVEVAHRHEDPHGITRQRGKATEPHVPIGKQANATKDEHARCGTHQIVCGSENVRGATMATHVLFAT